MPIATGHEREELEAELEVSLFFTVADCCLCFICGWIDIVGCWLIILPFFFLLNLLGLGKGHSGN